MVNKRFLNKNYIGGFIFGVYNLTLQRRLITTIIIIDSLIMKSKATLGHGIYISQNHSINLILFRSNASCNTNLDFNSFNTARGLDQVILAAINMMKDVKD